MAEETDFENGTISNFQRHMTLTLALDQATWHTVMHHSLTSPYTPNFIKIGETFYGGTDVVMDGRTDIKSGFIRSTGRSRPNYNQVIIKYIPQAINCKL